MRVLLLAALASGACHTAPAPLASAARRPAAAARAAETSPGIVARADFDTTCSPCRDFHRFAAGGWLDATEIPANRTRVTSFSVANDRNLALVRAIVEGSARGVADGSLEAASSAWKIGAFYHACMDTAAVAARGRAPMQPWLDLVATVRSRDDVVLAWATHVGGPGGIAPFDLEPQPDPNDSRSLIGTLTQEAGFAGLEREFYLADDERARGLRARYEAHVARMLRLAGDDSAGAAAGAAAVMRLETALARTSMSRAETREPGAFTNVMTLDAFRTLTPHIDWHAYARALGGRMSDRVNVRTLRFFTGLDSLLAATDPADWRPFLRWRVAKASAPALGPEFVDEAFRWQQALTGVRTQVARADRCAAATNAVLGMAIGEEYVRRHVAPDTKARVTAMAERLRGALREHMATLDWMSEPTRREALAKLDRIGFRIAYPDVWQDFGLLRVTATDHFANAVAAWEYGTGREWAKQGKPVDWSAWRAHPQTVNAFYNEVANEVTIPAGIIQPPFYDPAADDGLNLGALGGVIAHELTHAFDPIGRRYDASGNLRDWWTAEDAARFRERTDRIAEQFSAYTIVDTATRVNGRLTLGENVADLGALKVVHLALRRSRESAGRRIDGFTPEQRLFIGWSRVWRQKVRDETARALASSAVHAPGVWRINGPLSNMPEFREAFACRAGDPMVRPDSLRGRVW